MDRRVKQAGLDLPQSRADETEAQCQLELERARQANRRLRRFNLVLVGVAAVAIVVLILAIRQFALAQARQLAANAQLAFDEGNTHLAVLLSLEAQNLDPTASEQLLNQTIPTQARHAPGRPIGEHDSPVLSVAWRPDGAHLASASFDRTIIIWDTHTWEQEIVLQGHHGAVSSVAWSPDGAHLASTSLDRTTIIWDTATWQQETVLQGHKDAVWNAAWHPDGAHLTTASSDRTISVWNTDTWERETVLTGHTDAVWSVAWRPDGSYLTSASSDRTIIVWDTDSWQQETALRRHTDSVWSVAWHPGGAHLASTSSDQTIRVTPQVFTRQPCYWLLGGNLSLLQWKEYRTLALYRPTCPNLAFIPIPFGLNADYLVYTLSGRLLVSGVILGGLAILCGLGVILNRARRKRRYIRK